MKGYGPAAEAIRAARGLPYATGADDPPAWHNIVGATGPGEPPAVPGHPDTQPEARPAA